MKSLLVISCSKTKINKRNSVPAFELYNGFFYKIIKKLQADGKFPNDMDILILSAKYGIIKPNTKIRYYDQIMTEDRAVYLNGETHEKLAKLIEQNNYDKIILNLGRTYKITVEGYEKLINPKREIIEISGGLGERASMMKNILIPN